MELMNEEWISQIKRGTLEYAILLLIKDGDRYGYDLMQTLDDYPMLKTKENTVYPLLRRLLKNGYLESYWRNTDDGVPPRKYYRITESGCSYLDELNSDWKTLMKDISKLRKEL